MTRSLDRALCAVLIASFTSLAFGQNPADVQRQYQEQQRERQERQREDQKRRDQQRDHDQTLNDFERQRQRQNSSASGDSSSPTPSALDIAVVTAAAAAALAILASREPPQVDQARAYRLLNQSRQGHVMQSCKANARLQAMEMMKSRPEQADTFWIQADTVCGCFGTRAVAILSEPELAQLIPYHLGTSWARISPARVQEAFLPCGLGSNPTGLLNVRQLASVQSK